MIDRLVGDYSYCIRKSCEYSNLSHLWNLPEKSYHFLVIWSQWIKNCEFKTSIRLKSENSPIHHFLVASFLLSCSWGMLTSVWQWQFVRMVWRSTACCWADSKTCLTSIQTKSITWKKLLLFLKPHMSHFIEVPEQWASSVNTCTQTDSDLIRLEQNLHALTCIYSRVRPPRILLLVV